jgi:PemK-like protein.
MPGRRNRWTEEELDALSQPPRPGEVWWCDGRALALTDGGKMRPVLVVGVSGGTARVLPLTSQKPEGAPTQVAHRAGTSWLIYREPESISVRDLTAPLGTWSGYAAWRRAARL